MDRMRTRSAEKEGEESQRAHTTPCCKHGRSDPPDEPVRSAPIHTHCGFLFIQRPVHILLEVRHPSSDIVYQHGGGDCSSSEMSSDYVHAICQGQIAGHDDSLHCMLSPNFCSRGLQLLSRAGDKDHIDPSPRQTVRQVPSNAIGGTSNDCPLASICSPAGRRPYQAAEGDNKEDGKEAAVKERMKINLG